MSLRFDLEYMSGDVCVNVRAIDENGDDVEFSFTSYISDDIGSYDKLNLLYNIVYCSARLRKFSQAEIIGVVGTKRKLTV